MKKEEALLEYAQIRQKINEIIKSNPQYKVTILVSELQKLIDFVDKMMGDSNINKLDILEGLE